MASVLKAINKQTGEAVSPIFLVCGHTRKHEVEIREIIPYLFSKRYQAFCTTKLIARVEFI